MARCRLAPTPTPTRHSHRRIDKRVWYACPHTHSRCWQVRQRDDEAAVPSSSVHGQYLVEKEDAAGERTVWLPEGLQVMGRGRGGGGRAQAGLRGGISGWQGRGVWTCRDGARAASALRHIKAGGASGACQVRVCCDVVVPTCRRSELHVLQCTALCRRAPCRAAGTTWTRSAPPSCPRATRSCRQGAEAKAGALRLLCGTAPHPPAPHRTATPRRPRRPVPTPPPPPAPQPTNQPTKESSTLLNPALRG